MNSYRRVHIPFAPSFLNYSCPFQPKEHSVVLEIMAGWQFYSKKDQLNVPLGPLLLHTCNAPFGLWLFLRWSSVYVSTKCPIRTQV